MIQRIQSFYLVLAVCAIALCFMFPVATFETTDDAATKVISQLNLIPRSDSGEADVLRQVEMGEPLVTMPQRSATTATWPLALVAAVAGVLTLVSIFLFKNRMRQVRVVACAFLLNVVYLFVLFIGTVDHYADQVAHIGAMVQAEQVKTTYSVATWAAVAAVVLLFLAQRAIKRDEAKVRAADRLR